jgi:carboxypeptidase Taq
VASRTSGAPERASHLRHPRELAALKARLAEIADLGAIGALLQWDQSAMMPPAGAPARGHHAATLEKVLHERLTHPELARLLDAVEPWAAGLDPDSDDARLVRTTRRDAEKARRVPAELAAEIAEAGALGEQAWLRAREADDFSLFRDALAHHLELRHRYAACFDVEHPYDALLDDFEPGMTTARLRPLFEELRAALVPLVAAVADPDAPDTPAALRGDFPVERQRAAMVELATPIGFDERAFRLDPAPHPFAMGVALRDVRLTTRYEPGDLSPALYSVLHELGHGLYEAGAAPALDRTPLATPASLGVHESQSRLWENVIGRSRAFCGWMLPILARHFPGPLGAMDAEKLFRSVNAVRPSAIRIFADETTYNLHVVLRFELEVALMEGALAVDDLPAAWDDGMLRLLGVEVPGPAHGLLQDIHWGAGMIGYFPTYTLGNLIAAQLWERLRQDLPDVEEQLARGAFAEVLGWMREHIHRHGRKFEPAELVRRSTGTDVRVAPFLDYLRSRLDDAGLLGRTSAPSST